MEEIVGLLVVVGIPVLIIVRRRQARVRRPCPECKVVNMLDRNQLGTSARCSSCGSLLFPAEHPGASMPAGGPVQHTVEKIIERQVVVERCDHCGQLTPVDARTCQACGAGR